MFLIQLIRYSLLTLDVIYSADAQDKCKGIMRWQMQSVDTYLLDFFYILMLNI